MTDEEALMSSVKDIIDSAGKADDQQYDEYCQKVAKEVESTLWDQYGSIEAYELWCLHMRLMGQPEQLAKLQEDNKDIQSLVVKPDEMEINSCIELAMGYTAADVKLPNLNDLLNSPAHMIALTKKSDLELVGFVARTGAWISSKPGERPSEADDKKSVTVTMYMCAGRLVVMTRDDETGNLIDEATQVIRYFKPDSKEDRDETVECAEWLMDKYGKLAHNLYSAWAFPRLFNMMDPELLEAMSKDASSSADDEETEQ